MKICGITKMKMGYKKKTVEKQNNHNDFFRSLVKVSFFIIVVINGQLTLLFFQDFNTVKSYTSNECKELKSQYKHYREVVVVGWLQNVHLYTSQVSLNGVIHLNFTVLPCSNTTVFFNNTDIENPIYHWSPKDPDNISLAPGESYAETFALEGSGVDYIGVLSYVAVVQKPWSNATIVWWYEIVKKGFYLPSYMSIIFGVCGLILLVLFFLIGIELVLDYYRKKEKKEKGLKE